ncbi:SulP family inorganic anion transporter [Aquitalea denitrificans]|uniref:SulP family inorganic anion transporter n=1 Tax=Aquitalea denitrificans TaxID=519081 RepID=UPI00135BC31E|nr:SulP family inorganic anion transporter [Aquitalea denitrificans]
MKSFHSIAAGLITASIAISVNAAFSDLLSTALHTVAARALLFSLMMAACCLAMLLVAGNSRLKLAIPGLDEPAMVILAALATTSTLHLASLHVSPEQLLSTLLITNALTALLAAAVFLLAARFRAGQLARCLPFPVLAAFMASSGLLLVVFGLSISASHSLSISQLASWHLSGLEITQLGWGLAFGLLLLLCMRKVDHPAMLTALLSLACLLSPSSPALSTGSNLPTLQLVAPVWSEILAALPTMAAAAIMAMLGSTSNIMALDQAQHAGADLNHELRMNGIACLGSALCAGPPVSVMLSDSLLAGSMGAQRWPLAISFIACGMVAIWQQQLMLSLIQPFVLGGVLVYFGLELLSQWLRRWSALASAERGILLGTMLTFLLVNVVAGIAVGLVLSALLFCYRASQENLLRTIAVLPGNPLRAEQGLLKVELTGQLYFGSASRLHDQLQVEIRQHLPRGGSVQLCLRHASLDSSAMQALHRLRLWCEQQGYPLQLACHEATMASQLRRWGMTVQDEAPRLAPSHPEGTHHRARAATTSPRFLHLLQTGRD